MHIYICVCVYIYYVTRVMQSSSNELSTSVSNSIKYKQKKVNTYMSKFLACIGAADGYGVMLSGCHKVSWVLIPFEAFHVSSHTDEL